MLLELMAYINTNERLSKWECSERRDSIIKFAGGGGERLGCGGVGATPRGTVHAILEISIQVRFKVFFFLYIYIYVIDVTLNY
jgi:hypothetical protein